MLPIRDHAPAGGFPLITLFIIALNMYVFLLQISSPDPQSFIYSWALLPSQLDWANPNSLIPLVTSQFLHGSILHILSNMWFLLIFGDNVEFVLGKIKYLLFYLASGVVAAIVQLEFMTRTDIPLLGASGAIAGVLGFYLARFGQHKVDVLIPLGVLLTRGTLPAQIVLFLWFVSQLLSGSIGAIANAGSDGGVAWWAHIGGFVFGYIVAKLIGSVRPLIQGYGVQRAYR